jgi:hypothetical protein
MARSSGHPGRIAGSFETAFEDSAFYGETVPIVGVARGDCISFASVGSSRAGHMVVSYTGLLRGGRLETVWYFVTDDGPWWKAVTANTDTSVCRN